MKDYLRTFLDTLRSQMAHEGAYRSAKKLDALMRADARAADNFVPVIRKLALMSTERIAANHAARHGMQKPLGDAEANFGWEKDVLGRLADILPTITVMNCQKAAA